MMDLNFNKEFDRLKTFILWPKSTIKLPTLKKFAYSGFYYTGKNDIVKCHFCQVEIGGWTVGDIIYKEHKKWSSNCPLINNPNLTTNIPLVTNDLMLYEKKVLKNSKIASEEFQCFSKRLDSFVGWLDTNQDPILLSMTGFYYLGVDDHVRCFCCGGCLKNWEKDDVPMEQHALHYKDCSFIKNVKSML